MVDHIIMIISQRKVVIVFLVCLVLIFNKSIAQNARMDALGNSFVIDDISAIAGNPTSSIQFSDMIQATAYQDGSFGPVIGIKSLGKWIVLGFTANKKNYSDTVFYSEAKLFLDSTIDTISKLNSQFPSYPHLVFGLDLPIINIGCELFYERSKLETTSQSSADLNTLAKKDIMTSGATLSAAIQLKSFGIYPYFGYSIPRMQGTFISGDSTTIASTSNSLFADAGTEIGFDIKNSNYRLGGCYSIEKYSFSYDGNARYGNPKKNSLNLNGYGGITSRPTQELLLSIAYSFNYYTNTTNYNYDIYTYKETQIYLSHFAVGCCEYNIPLKIIFDRVVLRSGIVWSSTNSTYTNHSDSSSITSDVKKNYPADVSSFIPTVGLGISKGIVQFDIASKLAGWSGLTAGMPVVTGTLTLDFVKER
jgi:hypothetical protein